MPDTVTLIVEFSPRAGCGADLRSALEEMIGPSENEPGCRGYRPLVDPRRPGTLVLIEENRVSRYPCG